jgi:hypothetical protein
MKFTKPINLWTMQDSQIKALQAGQWVYGGQTNNKGRFLGVKPSGTVVVAWQGNTNMQQSKTAYIRALRDYALGK